MRLCYLFTENKKHLHEIRDFSNAAMQHTNSAARNIGRDANFLISCLVKKYTGWEMRLSAINSKADVVDKIDAWWSSGPHDGESIQMIRRIAGKSREDYAIKIVDKQFSDNAILDKDIDLLISRYGSKFSAATKFHIMLNADDTKIFIAKIDDIRAMVNQAIAAMKRDARFRGQFSFNRQSFVDHTTGVNLRVAQSAEGYSVLAYVPAQMIKNVMVISVNKKDMAECEKGNVSAPHNTKPSQSPASSQASPQKIQEKPKTELEKAVDQAKAEGSATIEIKSTSPNGFRNKMYEISTIAKRNGLKVTNNGNNSVTLSK